nr:MAG TPA: hypothetical protein [Caudoviricetes sp.]
MSTSSAETPRMQPLRQDIVLNMLIRTHLSYYKTLQSNLILTRGWLSLRLIRSQRRKKYSLI